MKGQQAREFDRTLLTEYNKELQGALKIEDTEDMIIVSFSHNMDEVDKNNAHLILELWDFE